MEIIKTICPRCFKVFSVPEEIDEAECNFCEYVYDLPKFNPRGDLKDYYYLSKDNY